MARKKRSFLVMFDEKKMYPKTGKGYVVKRVASPTMNKGSMDLWVKRFDTKKDALVFYRRKKLKKVM